MESVKNFFVKILVVKGIVIGLIFLALSLASCSNNESPCTQINGGELEYGYTLYVRDVNNKQLSYIVSLDELRIYTPDDKVLFFHESVHLNEELENLLIENHYSVEYIESYTWKDL